MEEKHLELKNIREQLEKEMDQEEIKELEENDENKNILFKQRHRKL